MSANNYIRIRRMKNRPMPYEVTVRDYESGELIETIGNDATADGALVMAEHYMEGEEVEYGIRYVF